MCIYKASCIVPSMSQLCGEQVLMKVSICLPVNQIHQVLYSFQSREGNYAACSLAQASIGPTGNQLRRVWRRHDKRRGRKGMWILFCFPCMLPSLSLTDSPTMFVKYLDRVHKIEISREKKKSGQHHLNDKVTTWERGLWWLFASSPLSVVWFSWP